MTDYLYRMSYPIEDDSLRTSQVINQAVLVFPGDAEERGIRVIGDVRAWIDGATVHCEAVAEIIDGRKPKLTDLHGWRVVALHAAGENDRSIAEQLGLPSPQTVQRIRTELGLQPHGRRAA